MTYKIFHCYLKLLLQMIRYITSFHEEFVVFNSVTTDRDLSTEWFPILQQVHSDTLHIYFFSWQSGHK